MIKENDIFAHPITITSGDKIIAPGMTLRDYYAGLFMATVLPKLATDPSDEQYSRIENAVVASFKVADLMLKARQGGEDNND